MITKNTETRVDEEQVEKVGERELTETELAAITGGCAACGNPNHRPAASAPQ